MLHRMVRNAVAWYCMTAAVTIYGRLAPEEVIVYGGFGALFALFGVYLWAVIQAHM